MTYHDFLITKAGVHWTDGDPIPTDLSCEMTNAGLDVDKEEKLFNLINNAD